MAIDAAVIDYYNTTGTWNASGTVEDTFGGFHQYVLTNPGNDMSVFIDETSEQINLTKAQLGYPEAKRDYTAIELTLNRPLQDGWTIDMSYTWSESEGNHEGYVISDIAQDDAGITQNFDQPGLTDYQDGPLPNDRTHTFKAFGSYEFNNGFRIGANFLAQSGRPYGCMGVHPTDVFAADYGAFSRFCGGVPQKRGNHGELPTITNMDLNAQYTVEIGNTDVLLSLDVFNVFNSDKKVRISEVGETFGGAPEPNYLKPTAYQLPRTLRLSARFNLF